MSTKKTKRYYHLYEFAFPSQPYQYITASLVLIAGILLYSDWLNHIAYAASVAASAPAAVEVTVPTVVTPVAPVTTTGTVASTATVVIDARLDTTSPPAGVVRPGDQAVAFTVVKLSTTGDVQLNNLEVSSQPSGANNFANIRLFDGSGMQIGQTINALSRGPLISTGVVSNTGVALAAGSAKFITIKADVLPTAQGTGSLALSSITYTSSVSVTLRGLPVVGSAMQLTSTPPPPLQPDLVISSLSLTSSARMYAGSPFDADDVTMVVKNQGAAASGPFRVQLNVRDARTNQLQCSWSDTVTQLVAGTVHAISPDHSSFINCPPLAAQAYYLEGVADVSATGASEVAESNETNNVARTDSFLVQPLSQAPQIFNVNLVQPPQTGSYPVQRISFTATSAVPNSVVTSATLLYRNDNLYQPTARVYDHRRVITGQAGTFSVDIPITSTQITHYAIVVTHTNVATADYTNQPTPVTSDVTLPTTVLYAGYPFMADGVAVSYKNQTTNPITLSSVSFNVRVASSNTLQCSAKQLAGTLLPGRLFTVKMDLAAFVNCPPLAQTDYYLEVVPQAAGSAPFAPVRTGSVAVRPAVEAPLIASVTGQVFSTTRAQISFTLAAAAGMTYTPSAELWYNDNPAYAPQGGIRQYNKSRTATRVTGTPWFRVDLTTSSMPKHYAIHANRTNVVTPDYNM